MSDTNDISISDKKEFLHPRLSILICSIPGRKEHLTNLLANLNSQIVKIEAVNGIYGAVEILVDDELNISIGSKRNNLMSRALGDYTVFIDDDDQVSMSYIEDILTAIESNPDVVTMGLFYNEPNGTTSKWEFSIANKAMGRRDGVLQMYPTHLCPMRRSISTLVRFPDTNIGEDNAWSKNIMLTGLLKTEVSIGDAYHYMYRPSKHKMDYGVDAHISVLTFYNENTADNIDMLFTESSGSCLSFCVKCDVALQPEQLNNLLKVTERVRVCLSGYTPILGPYKDLNPNLILLLSGKVKHADPFWDREVRKNYETFASKGNGDFILAFNDGRAINNVSWLVLGEHIDTGSWKGTYSTMAAFIEELRRISIMIGKSIYFSKQLFKMKGDEIPDSDMEIFAKKAKKNFGLKGEKFKTRPQYAITVDINKQARMLALIENGKVKPFILTFEAKDRVVFDYAKDNGIVPILANEDNVVIGNGIYQYDALRVDYNRAKQNN